METVDKKDEKRKQLNTNALRYYYKKQEDVLRKQKEKYDNIKDFKIVAKQFMKMYDAVLIN